MKHYTSEQISQQRISNWLLQATSVDIKPSWTEKRMAIDFGGHTFILNDGQVFQCAHCGVFDPKWTVTEVLSYFEQFGVKPYEIEITCSVAKVE